jgi:hypothetical protein
MTKDEAKARTIKGIWNCIEPNIQGTIENACDCGKNEVRVDKMDLSAADAERLEKLGYYVTLDDSDMWCPEYIIKWE